MTENLNDLRAFVLVAKMGSFTKAASHLGVSQSALSYTIRTLEKQVGIKLLNRTTRSVSPTQAGEQLLNDIEPLISQISEKINQLNEFRDSPRGILRINCTEHVVSFLLWDKLTAFINQYPDIVLEITSDYAMTDIVKERYDVGIRLGGSVDQDMIAVKVTPDMQMILVASPEYITQSGSPDHPDEINSFRCLTLRLPSHENIMSWEFNDIRGDTHQDVITVKPHSAMIVNHANLLIKAAKEGLGLAWVPATMVSDELASGKLVTLLGEWSITYDGYYMYYPARNPSPLFRLLVDALKKPNKNGFLHDTR